MLWSAGVAGAIFVVCCTILQRKVYILSKHFTALRLRFSLFKASPVFSEPPKIYSEPWKFFSEPPKIFSEPRSFFSESPIYFSQVKMKRFNEVIWLRGVICFWGRANLMFLGVSCFFFIGTKYIGGSLSFKELV